MEVSTVVDDQIVTTPIDSAAKKTLDKTLTVKDKVLIALQTWATQRESNEVYQTVDDLVGATGVFKPTLSTQLAVMVKNREIELIKAGNHSQAKIIGFKLLKAPKPDIIIANGTEKAKSAVKNSVPKIKTDTPELSRYAEQHEAVKKARQVVVEAGLPEYLVSDMEKDPIAEEAFALMQELLETKIEFAQYKIDVESKRRAEPFVKEPANASS